jgi:phospholipid/cholesterol/gamma-HCH transport system ATP-binding protein
MIKVRNLWKRYGQLQVLKGLDLDVFDNETLVILGPSGVGKSVLLKQILGLESPDEGTIEIDGENVQEFTKRESYRIHKPMGMLFQGAALFDSMNVGDNVAFYLMQHNPELSLSEIEDRVAHALNVVGLKDIQKKLPSELSGGMRKRAAFARLIVYRPQIILYDEPTTGLDPITANQINELINQTKAELKATSIVVTHDLRSAMDVGDRLAFHCDGRIKCVAPKNEFLSIDDPVVQNFFRKAVVEFPHIQKGDNY